jgi:signal transduction histidine kinase
VDAKEGRHGPATTDYDSLGASASGSTRDTAPDASGGRRAPLEFADLRAYDWLNIPAWVYDGERYRHCWANAAGLRFWRSVSLDELCSRSYADTSETTRARISLSMQAHARGETTVERWTLYPQGLPTSILLQGTAIRLPDGRTGILFMAELGMQMEPNVIRGVEALNHAAVLVGVHRLHDGKVLMRNPAAELAFGLVDALARGNSFVGMFSSEDLGWSLLNRVAAGESIQTRTELLTRSAATWHLVGARRSLDPATGESVAIVHAIDIAELMLTQQALESARERAEAASRAKSSFLRIVNHELRTPINGILGTLHLLERTNLEARQRKWVQMSLESGVALSTLIGDVVELAEVEAGDRKPAHELFDIRAIIEAALRPLEPEALRKGLDFTQEVAPEVPQCIVGDGRWLRQIVFNLAANALRFTARGSVRIDVGMCDIDGERHCVRIEVADTGEGIAPEQQEVIFRPFVQLDQSSTRRHGGMGLGLTLVRGLVERLGGFLELQSALGQGTRFSVVLPIG